MTGLLFYAKLAKSNIQRNQRNYLPFWISCLTVVAFFFNLTNIRRIIQDSEKVYGNTTVAGFLMFGTVIVGILALIFVFYANAFLMKYRKKELALYGILGLEKRHIAFILLLEVIVIAGSSIFAGIFMGAAFGKLLFLLMQKIIRYQVPMDFSIYLESIVITMASFGILFLAVFCFNFITIHLTEPIELLRSKNQGEKKIRFLKLTGLVGLICLAGGYYIAIAVKNPMQAMVFFFWAVLLVIVATHYLFLAGSVIVLNLLKKSRRFYYRPTNFISTSSLIYRMKKNAAGLANICILSCMVMVTVAGTATVYGNMERVIEAENPAAYTKSWTYKEGKDRLSAYQELLYQYAEESGVTVTEEYHYQTLRFLARAEGNQFKRLERDYNTLWEGEVEDYVFAYVMRLEDYEKLTGHHPGIVLKAGEIATSPWSRQVSDEVLRIGEKEYRMKGKIPESAETKLISSRMIGGVDTLLILVKDTEELLSLTIDAGDYMELIEETLAFDVEGTPEAIEVFHQKTKESRKNSNRNQNFFLSIREENIQSFYSLNGGLYFIGIFLGALFLMLTVLIIYFKQISEGEEDRERFTILKKVGLSSKEAKQVIQKQMVMMFFLPLVTAIIHVSVATVIISRVLMIGFGIGLQELIPYMGVTMGIFAVIYFAVYLWTSRTYYQIVHGNAETVPIS